MAITLSDPFCVERHRAEFLRMLGGEVDLLVANEHELMSLYQTADLAAAMDRAEAQIPITACTVGARGAHVVAEGGRWHTPATAARVVDATGAGDLFAAGFLYGVTTGRDWLTCAAHGLRRRRRGHRPHRRPPRSRPAGSCSAPKDCT